MMSIITLCYSTHRPETLSLTARVMQDHQVIILEEPLHLDFPDVLSGAIALEEHLLELDVGYPEFAFGQYRMLQQFSRAGKEILQVEPYLEHLLQIQFFLAEDHRPEEIEAGTVASLVYGAERDATGMLITYYQEVRGDDFAQILSAMNAFARADAARFRLRDTLRVKGILELLSLGKDTYIEAGSIHLLLYRLFAKSLRKSWRLRVHSVDREAVKRVHRTGSLFSPGDELTLSYIFGRQVSRQKWQLQCAQALIYSKIISKEELCGTEVTFPHTRNEIESITAVKRLSLDMCKDLFFRIRSLSSEEAMDYVKTSWQTGRSAWR